MHSVVFLVLFFALRVHRRIGRLAHCGVTGVCVSGEQPRLDWLVELLGSRSVPRRARAAAHARGESMCQWLLEALSSADLGTFLA